VPFYELSVPFFCQPQVIFPAAPDTSQYCSSIEVTDTFDSRGVSVTTLCIRLHCLYHHHQRRASSIFVCVYYTVGAKKNGAEVQLTLEEKGEEPANYLQKIQKKGWEIYILLFLYCHLQ